MADKGKKGGKRGRKLGRGSRNDKRARYWNSGRLEKRKVGNLVRCCGMCKAEATRHWRKVRLARVSR